MKRFYQDAAAAPLDGGWTVALDGRPIRTPAKAPFVVAAEPVAAAAAAEWAAQGEELRPAEMLVTKAINTAIDHTATHHGAVAEAVAAFGGSDLLCYRAEGPMALVERQAAAWDPLLTWAEGCYGAKLSVQFGLMHKAQPPEAEARLRQAVDLFDPLALTALSDLVALSGSLIIGLAVAERRLDQDTAWAVSRIDEIWQEEQWGADDLAARAAAHKSREFAAAARLLDLAAGA